jgi:hypothetical protein
MCPWFDLISRYSTLLGEAIERVNAKVSECYQAYEAVKEEGEKFGLEFREIDYSGEIPQAIELTEMKFEM